MFGCVRMDIRVIFWKNLFFCFLDGLFFNVLIVIRIFFLGFLFVRLVVWFRKYWYNEVFCMFLFVNSEKGFWY